MTIPTGYENAPATKFLATHCLICRKPLVDAESVERALGPCCARMHGYDNASAPADWSKYLDAYTGQNIPTSFAAAYIDGNAHKLANLIVNRIVMNLRDAQVVSHIKALHAIGYSQLAETIVKRRKIRMVAAVVRVAPTQADREVVKTTQVVKVRRAGGKVYVSGPYHTEFKNAVKAIKGAWWHMGTKEWSVYDDDAAALNALITRHYPGATLESDKGAFVIASI